jgi:plastocyanin
VIPPRETDQQMFDAAVNRDGKIFLQILGALGIVAALVMSTIALVVSTSKTHATVASSQAPAVAAAPAPPVAPIKVTVAGENKRGPDGKLHDSFSKTNFAVKVGQATRLRIDNKDASAHSITAAGTGVSLMILPGTHTYTIRATTTGRFEWICVIPCDGPTKGWAMTHPGYMAGYITAS